MDYSDFTLLELDRKFGLTNTVSSLFAGLAAVDPGDLLTTQLKRTLKLPLRSEQAKSELVVSPILREGINRNSDFFTFYSGENLTANRVQGSMGESECRTSDFFISRHTGSFAMNMPILAVIEARRDNLEAGVDQCAAQLYGASLVSQGLGHPVPDVLRVRDQRPRVAVPQIPARSLRH